MANEVSRSIVWQKWVNPLTGVGAENEIEVKEEEDEKAYKDSAEQYEDMIRTLRAPKPYEPKLNRIIASPLGYLPLDEHGDPAVVYDFWMMHTNFDISPKVQETGSRIPGVEGWNTFSRYRARIAFGKLFDRSKVKQAIQEALGCGSKTLLVREPDCRAITLEQLKKQLSSTTPHWAILETEDGQRRTIRGSEKHVRQNVENLKALPNPPRIITSWDK